MIWIWVTYHIVRDRKIVFSLKEVMGDIVWGESNTLHPQKGAPIVHYQVQNGELATLFTDPSLTPYKDSKFIKPRWIK